MMLYTGNIVEAIFLLALRKMIKIFDF